MSATDVIEGIRGVLRDRCWVWVGESFVRPEQVAFESKVVAHPYLYVLPRELACFRTLLTTYGVREMFGPTDFVAVLAQMARAALDASGRCVSPYPSLLPSRCVTVLWAIVLAGGPGLRLLLPTNWTPRSA